MLTGCHMTPDCSAHPLHLDLATLNPGPGAGRAMVLGEWGQKDSQAAAGEVRLSVREVAESYALGV